MFWNLLFPRQAENFILDDHKKKIWPEEGAKSFET
jgi:hypothetical protein